MARAKKDQLIIEMPMEGFTEESIANLKKMVAAKEPLIKQAVGAKALPIKVEGKTIRFPWFTGGGNEQTECYAQFIAALCRTAKEKKRVTATEPGSGWSNPRFSFRVFLISLGMVGPEYKAARHALCAHLPGNAAWSSGIDPRRKAAPEKAEDAPENPSPEA